MSYEFRAGDYLIFQIESGYGLLRVLDVTQNSDGSPIWHLTAYSNLFPDIELAESSIESGLDVQISHVALTNRAFESTQVSKLDHKPLTDNELKSYENWKTSQGAVLDRSIRLILGLR